MKLVDPRGEDATPQGPMLIRLPHSVPGWGVRGEDGGHLEQGRVHIVSAVFGQMLVSEGRARRAEYSELIAQEEADAQEQDAILLPPSLGQALDRYSRELDDSRPLMVLVDGVYRPVAVDDDGNLVAAAIAMDSTGSIVLPDPALPASEAQPIEGAPEIVAGPETTAPVVGQDPVAPTATAAAPAKPKGGRRKGS